MTEIKPTLSQLYEARKVLNSKIDKEIRKLYSGEVTDVTTIFDMENRLDIIEQQIKELSKWKNSPNTTELHVT